MTALPAVVMNINSSEGGTEGSIGLPLTLIRRDVAKTSSSASVLMKLHGDAAALRAVKRSPSGKQVYSPVGREVTSGVMSQATVLKGGL